MEIPKRHQVIMPYLILSGAQKFIDFAKDVFDAELTLCKMREDQETIMHAEIQINDNTIMVADSSTQWQTAIGNLFIYVNNADETFKKAVEAGSSTILELRDESYGRTCGVTDPFGNVWWITSVK